MWFKLSFPDYNRIKELSKDKEYKFTIFKIYSTIYCRFTYNEDWTDKFKADLMCNGYSDTYEPPEFKEWFSNTEEDYKKMCSRIELFYNRLMQTILNSNDEVFWLYDE